MAITATNAGDDHVDAVIATVPPDVGVMRLDRLPESETGAATHYLEFLLAHDEAPLDPEMLQQINASRRDRGGEWIPHEAILREFGG